MKFKQLLIIISALFLCYLLISTATAVSVTNQNQMKNIISSTKLNNEGDSNNNLFSVELINKTKAIITYLVVSFRISLVFLRWPIQAFINSFQYAFIENDFLRTVFNDFKTLSFNETMKVVFVFLTLPFSVLYHVINYAFIQNDFFRILFTDFFEGLQQVLAAKNTF